MLPGQAAALEREIVGLGVSDKVKDRARQVFERSADQAGFFAHGRNRLVMPGFASRPPDALAPADLQDSGPTDEKKKSGGGGGGISDHDPLIIGLFQKLPAPESEWAAPARLKWLQTAANVFDLLYKGDGGIVVSMARADRSPRHDE